MDDCTRAWLFLGLFGLLVGICLATLCLAAPDRRTRVRIVAGWAILAFGLGALLKFLDA